MQSRAWGSPRSEALEAPFTPVRQPRALSKIWANLSPGAKKCFSARHEIYMQETKFLFKKQIFCPRNLVSTVLHSSSPVIRRQLSRISRKKWRNIFSLQPAARHFHKTRNALSAPLNVTFGIPQHFFIVLMLVAVFCSLIARTSRLIVRLLFESNVSKPLPKNYFNQKSLKFGEQQTTQFVKWHVSSDAEINQTCVQISIVFN